MSDDQPTEPQPAPGQAPADQTPRASGGAPPATPGQGTAAGYGAAPESRAAQTRARAVGGALASRTAGWMVAAALGGSLITLLLTGQLHSSQVSVLRPAAAQAPAGVSRPAPAGPRRVQFFPGPAGGSARRIQVFAGPGRVIYRRGQVSIVRPPRAYRQAVPGLMPVPLPGARQAQVRALAPRAYGQAVPGSITIIGPRGRAGAFRVVRPAAFCPATVWFSRLRGRRRAATPTPVYEMPYSLWNLCLNPHFHTRPSGQWVGGPQPARRPMGRRATAGPAASHQGRRPGGEPVDRRRPSGSHESER